MSFPDLMAGVGELYGASSARVCEARAFAADLDALDREELALERTVQALVARKAPDPIGLKFYRMVSPQPGPPTAASGGVQPSRVRAEGSGVRDDAAGDASDDDDGDDMEEDEMDDEADEEEDEDEEDDDAFPLDSDGGDSGDDDPFAREDDVSMDLDAAEEEEGAAAPRRETW